MSRFRGNWLNDEPEEVPEPPPISAPLPPIEPNEWVAIEPPELKRGQWLADDLDRVASHQADDSAPARKLYPIPKWTGASTGIAALLFVVLALIAIVGNANVAKGLIVAPVLAWIAYTIAQRLAIADGQPAIVPILMGGLCVKFIGVLARYWISLQVYGRSDATEYVYWGNQIAPGLRHFHMMDIGRLRGTNFIRFVTGVVFAITPGGQMVGYFVFGFFAYIGMIFFWRAFKRALPGVQDLTYLQVLMLMPSLAFWPSSIGKDAWMVMGVGIASYGVANILTNRTLVGWGSFIVGIYAILSVRPHVGIALMVGLVVAELFRARGSQGAGRAGLSLILMFFLGGLVMGSAASFLGIESWDKASVDQELSSVGDRTSEGRSEFSPTPVNSPVQFPMGAFTVMLRPMPYETHSPQEMLSAVENVAMLGFLLWSLPRLFHALKGARKRPYLLYCIGAITVFIIEYSSFSNFALIARQRTQIIALLLVFLVLPRKDPVIVDQPSVRNSPDPAPSES